MAITLLVLELYVSPAKERPLGGLILRKAAVFVFLVVSVIFLVEPRWRSQRQRRRAHKAGQMPGRIGQRVDRP